MLDKRFQAVSKACLDISGHIWTYPTGYVWTLDMSERPDIHTSTDTSHAPCSHHKPCSMLHAPCSMLHAPCSSSSSAAKKSAVLILYSLLPPPSSPSAALRRATSRSHSGFGKGLGCSAGNDRKRRARLSKVSAAAARGRSIRERICRRRLRPPCSAQTRGRRARASGSQRVRIDGSRFR